MASTQFGQPYRALHFATAPYLLSCSTNISPQSQVNSLIDSLKKELSSRSLSEFKKLQYSIQLKWLEEGRVGQVEHICTAGKHQ